MPDVLSLLWLCQYAPDSSVFLPLYVATTTLPTAITSGCMHQYSADSMWWSHCVVGNYAARFYRFAMQPVRQLQQRQQGQMNRDVFLQELQITAILQEAATQTTGATTRTTNLNAIVSTNDALRTMVESLLTKFCVKQGDDALLLWKQLFPRLLSEFRDGYHITTAGNAHRSPV